MRKVLMVVGLLWGGALAQGVGQVVKVLKNTPELLVTQMTDTPDMDRVFTDSDVRRFAYPKSTQAAALVANCKALVLPLLVSPGSAQFNEQFAVLVYPRQRWIIQSTVDSQNKMGGLLRSQVTCFFRVSPLTGQFETTVEATPQ